MNKILFNFNKKKIETFIFKIIKYHSTLLYIKI
jgi:hypothetical protein